MNRKYLLGIAIFVAVLGASSFSYVEATWTHTLPDWLAAHTRAPKRALAL